MNHLIASIAVAFVLAESSSAQSFNLDMGGSVPSSAFGGAAGQPGFWQAIGFTWSSGTALVDVTGSASAATIASWSLVTGGFANDPSTSGDDDNLLDDYLSYTTFNLTGFSGLAPGVYTVYAYAWTPLNPVALTNVSFSGGTPVPVGGAWGGGYVDGVTHARQRIAVGSNGGFWFTVLEPGVLNGIQIVLETPVQATLFCDGSVVGSTCLACGNVGNAGNGCGNSTWVTGGRLDFTGMPGASAATDTLRLVTVQVAGPALFIQSDGLAAWPIHFGDGMLCAAVGIRRLEVANPAATGVASIPLAGSPALHIAGLVSAGDTKHYQAWYRDTSTYCSPDTFNLTNGWTITWLP